MSETIHNLETAAESPLVAHLDHTDSSSQLLASSLHGHSQFESSLRDLGQEGALLGLETELASLQKGVQGLNLNVVHQRDKTQAKFLERWS
jgi:fructose/tagatose bisphosphate aldolase